jgi:transposase
MERLEETLLAKTEELAKVTEEKNALEKKLETEKGKNVDCVSILHYSWLERCDGTASMHI